MKPNHFLDVSMVTETMSGVVRRRGVQDPQAAEWRQEAWAMLLERADTLCACFRSEASPRTFLGVVLDHHCIDWLRKQNRSRNLVNALPLVDAGFAIDSLSVEVFCDPLHARDERREYERRRLRLVAALEMLSIDERRIVHLRFVKANSASELAVELGCSADTARQRVHRVLVKLRGLMLQDPPARPPARPPGVETEACSRALASVRWNAPRASGEVTYFFNHVNNFIFRQLTGTIDPDENLPESFFTQGNARLQGFETHLDVRATDMVSFEAGVDYVRGQLTVLDQPLPRVPPLRARLGVRFQRNAFQAGAEGVFTGKQDRIFNVGGAGETPTAGYGLGKLFLAYSFEQGVATSTIAVHLDNVGNTLYRNHLNYLKDLAPEVGRDFRVTYTVNFR